MREGGGPFLHHMIWGRQLDREAQPGRKQQHLLEPPRRKIPLLLHIKSLKHNKRKRGLNFPTICRQYLNAKLPREMPCLQLGCGRSKFVPCRGRLRSLGWICSIPYPRGLSASRTRPGLEPRDHTGVSDLGRHHCPSPLPRFLSGSRSCP